MMTCAAHRLRSGFSLLELAVVLAIIALIAGAGMTMATSALENADRITTQERLNTIKVAIDSHLNTYGYLPCPADRALLPTNANFGVEKRTAPASDCDAAVAPGYLFDGGGGIIFGMVPVRSLGLPDSYAIDAWGNKLTYAVSRWLAARSDSNSTIQGQIVIRYGTLASSDTLTSVRNTLNYTGASDNGAGLVRLTFASTGSLANTMIVHINSTTTNHRGSYVVSGRTATTIDLLDSSFASFGAGTGNVEWQEPGTGAAYVVVSHGADGRGAFPQLGATIPANKLCNTSATANSSPPPCTDNTAPNLVCIDIENCDDDADFFETPYNVGTTAANYFDDFIVWGSNQLSRTAVNDRLYNGCPATVCERWCANCTANYPSASSTGDVNLPTSGTLITGSPLLCRKVISTASATCGAKCFWGGATAGGYQKCP